MPTPEKIAFFTAHKDEINTIIIRENSQRKKDKMESLSEEEIDVAIGEIMEFKMAGKSILKYKFAPGTTPIEVEKVDEPKSVQSSDTKRFEIVSCENGFMLKKDNTKFIFKTPKDLMKIFNDILFEADSNASR